MSETVGIAPTASISDRVERLVRLLRNYVEPATIYGPIFIGPVRTAHPELGLGSPETRMMYYASYVPNKTQFAQGALLSCVRQGIEGKLSPDDLCTVIDRILDPQGVMVSIVQRPVRDEPGVSVAAMRGVFHEQRMMVYFADQVRLVDGAER